MAKIVVMYDLAEKTSSESVHLKFKESLIKKGYTDNFTVEGKTGMYYLPNTTLIHLNGNLTKARTDILNTAKEVGADLERYYSVEYNNWDGVPGKPYKR